MKLPALSLLRKEDYADAPEWFDNAMPVINDFFERIYATLNGNLDFVNLDMAVESMTVTNGVDIGTGTKGYSFLNRIKRTPMAVVIGKIQVSRTSTNTELANGTHVNWSYDGKHIKIQSIAGLVASTKYDINLVVM